MKVIVDADSAPFKEDIAAAAKKRGIRAVAVMSTAHYSERLAAVYDVTVTVDNEPQAVDTRIMNVAKKGDIIITDDTALAYMLQAKGAVVISGRGAVLSTRNLAAAMEIRHNEMKLRRSKKRGPKPSQGPKKQTVYDRGALIAALEKAMDEGGAN